MTIETPDKGVAETSKSTPTPPSPPLNLGARLFGARLALFWEQLWPALLPALTLAGVFLALALFDILPLLPRWLHGLVLALTAGGLVWLMWRGLRHVSIAGRAGLTGHAGIAAARRRIERDSGLAHRPLQALSDHICAGGDDADSVALWRLHQSRMAQAARRLRVGLPMPGAGRGAGSFWPPQSPGGGDRAVAQFRPEVTLVTLVLVYTAFVSLLHVLCALVFRRLPGLLAFGITVVDRRGKRPSRSRLVLRSAVPLLYAVGLPILCVEAPAGVPAAVVVLLVTAAAAVWSVATPCRGPLDRIAGTWLVPR